MTDTLSPLQNEIDTLAEEFAPAVDGELLLELQSKYGVAVVVASLRALAAAPEMRREQYGRNPSLFERLVSLVAQMPTNDRTEGETA